MAFAASWLAGWLACFGVVLGYHVVVLSGLGVVLGCLRVVFGGRWLYWGRGPVLAALFYVFGVCGVALLGFAGGTPHACPRYICHLHDTNWKNETFGEH